VALIKKIKPGSSANVKGALLRSVRPPAVTGAARVKARLLASTGSWSGPLTSISLRWQRCTTTGKHCKTVAWGSTYRVTKADKGHGIHVVARAVGEDHVGVDAASRLLVIRR
jgi:hypothetical protein